MKIAKLFIPGKYESVFLYRGRLILVSEDKRLIFYDIQVLINELRIKYPSRAPIYEWLFGRTDWLRNPQAKSLYKNELIARIIKDTIDRCCNEKIDLDLSAQQEESVIDLSDLKFDVTTDCTIYNGYIYIASEKGLFSSSASWQGNIAVSGWNQRTDAKVIHTSARYGTINVSCGSDGLHSTFENYDSQNSNTAFNVIDSVSYKSSWCHYDVINYPDYIKPTFHETETKREPFRIEQDRTVIEKFGALTKPIWDLPGKEKPIKMPEEMIDHTFNSEQTFFVATTSGGLYRVPLVYGNDSKTPHIQRMSRMSRIKEKTFQKILSTHGLPNIDSVVVETFDSVDLLTPQGVHNLINESAISVRTFPKSHQYQNIIVVVTEDGAWLMSAFDDSIFEKCLPYRPMLVDEVRLKMIDDAMERTEKNWWKTKEND